MSRITRDLKKTSTLIPEGSDPDSESDIPLLQSRDPVPQLTSTEPQINQTITRSGRCQMMKSVIEAKTNPHLSLVY